MGIKGLWNNNLKDSAAPKRLNYDCTDPKPELDEKDFIHEGFRKNPKPALLWALITALIILLFWAANNWWSATLNEQYQAKPFLQVTNRELSLMLWQFPEYMRVSASNKSGYLTGFYRKTPGMEPEMADQYAVAPPHLLFLYHAWKDLIYNEFPSRPIQQQEFDEFLTMHPEWHPEFWSEAPESFREFIKEPPQKIDIREYLPFAVQRAFHGWKNFYKEGERVNGWSPTYRDVSEFLTHYPHYQRHYWRNILLDTYPEYLREEQSTEIPIPHIQMAPFLKVAMYTHRK